MSSTPGEPTRIRAMSIRQFKRLRLLEIEGLDESNVIRVRGRNAVGKTTFIQALLGTLCGARARPADPLGEGAREADTIVTLSNGMQARVHYTRKGGTLTLLDADGAKVSEPQAVLDSLIDQYSVDLTAFDRLDAKGQRSELARAAGLDIDEIAERRQKIYLARRDVNRDLDRATKALEAHRNAGKIPPGTPDEPVDVREISAEYRRRLDQKAENDRTRADAERLVAEANALKVRVDEAKAVWERLRAEHAAAYAEANRLCTVADSLVDPDVSDAQQQMESAAAVNQAVGLRRERERLENQVAELQRSSDRHSERLAKLDQRVTAAVAALKMPVDGLALTEEGVTLGGHPLSEASLSERLRVSAAIAMQRKPACPIGVVRELGALLDRSSWALLEQLVEEHGYQIFVEIMDPECDRLEIEVGDEVYAVEP